MGTSLKTTSDETEASASDLHEQVRSLREQLRRAQSLAAVGTMTAMIVHEFNNILTTALGRAQLAQNGDEASREKAIHCALDACTRATTVCQALLDLTGGDAEARQSVCVAQLITETLEAMAREPAKDGIVLLQKVPARLRITTRPVLLKQVLLNLLLNARAAVLAKGRGQSLSVSATRSNGQVLIRIADTGVGIAPENLQRIFEPFFTTRNGSGAGLGLPVCRQIVESLGGSIGVRSELGKGTVFSVALPTGTSRRPRRRTGQ